MTSTFWKSAALLAASTLTLLSLTACKDQQAAAESLADAAAPAVREQEFAAEIRDLKTLAAGGEATVEDAGRLSATGEMVADVHSELVPRQAGRIGTILVDEGESVRQGQALLEIEDDYLRLAVDAARAQLAQAAAGLAEAERELERKKGLFEKESISRAVYDRVRSVFEGATATHDLARVNLALAETQLEDAVLRSPIDGVVAARRVEVGESLSPGKPAFVIVRTRPLRLRFQLPERHLPDVHEGQTVTAYVDPYPGEAFVGTIRVVGQVIDPASRSLVVEALFENADQRLRPGLFARVEVDLGGKE